MDLRLALLEGNLHNEHRLVGFETCRVLASEHLLGAEFALLDFLDLREGQDGLGLLGGAAVRLVVLVDEQAEAGQNEVALDQISMLHVELRNESVKNDPVALLKTGASLMLLLRGTLVLHALIRDDNGQDVRKAVLESLDATRPLLHLIAGHMLLPLLISNDLDLLLFVLLIADHFRTFIVHSRNIDGNFLGDLHKFALRML